jgi:hypothetical protein
MGTVIKLKPKQPKPTPPLLLKYVILFVISLGVGALLAIYGY